MNANTRCAMPLYSLNTNADGHARLCCRSYVPLYESDTSQILSFRTHSLQEIWSSAHMDRIRQDLASGIKAPECVTCWSEEEGGRKLGKRFQENRKFNQRYGSFALRDQPSYLALNVGRKCNLKCRMCGSWYSSSIFAETKSLLQNDPDALYDLSHDERTGFELANKNQSISWIDETDLLDQIDYTKIDEFYITGGEPLLHSSVYQLLENCLANGRQDVRIRINTNLTKVDHRFLDLIKRFSNAQVICSIDAVGELAHYVRYPSRWSKIEENFHHLLCETIGITEIVVQATLSLYNIFSLHEVALWFNSVKSRQPRAKLYYYNNLVMTPKHLNIRLLPTPVCAVVRERLLTSSTTSPHDDVKRQMQDIVDYLTQSQPDPELLKIFFRMTRRIDAHRKQSLFQFQPDFLDGSFYPYR